MTEKQIYSLERVIQSAYSQALANDQENPDLATVEMLWEAFAKEAKRNGINNWKGIEL